MSRLKKLSSTILVISLIASFILFPSPFVYSEIPHLINYQGRLTNNEGAPLDGIYEVTFRIYDMETNGAPLWMEKHTGVGIEKGILSVMLGAVTDLNLPFDKPYFLEIKVEDEVMSPRQRITSVGYAMRADSAGSADNAATLDGSQASAFVNLTDKQTISGAKTITAASPATPEPNTLYSDNLIKAWVCFSGIGTAKIRDSFNVSSVARNGPGDYTIYWDRDFSNANYCVLISSEGSCLGARRANAVRTGGQLAGSVRINTGSIENSYDDPSVYVMAIGHQ